MEGVYPFRKYRMKRVEDIPVPSVDYGYDPPRIVHTIKYAGDGGTWRLPVDIYKALGEPEEIEIDTSRSNRETDFVIRKLK